MDIVRSGSIRCNGSLCNIVFHDTLDSRINCIYIIFSNNRTTNKGDVIW